MNPLTQMNGAQRTFFDHNRFSSGSRSQVPRGSIVTFLSAVSIGASGGCPGDQCARRNRKLRDYLNRILASHFEQSRRALEAWAYTAGVSVDRHMDWERTRTSPIADGMRKGSEPCDRCCTQTSEAPRAGGSGDSVLLMPPDASGMSLGGDTGAFVTSPKEFYQPRTTHFPQSAVGADPEGHMPPQPAYQHLRLQDGNNSPDDLSVPGQAPTNAFWAYYGGHPAYHDDIAAQTQQAEDSFTAACPDLGYYLVEDAAGNYPTPSPDGADSAAARLTISELLEPLAISEERTLFSVPLTVEDMRSMSQGARGGVVIE